MIRGFKTREVYLAVGSKGAWVPAPSSSMPIGGTGWGSMSQLTNGFFATVNGAYEAKAYTLTWPYIRGDAAHTLIDLLSRAGSQNVSYLDPFASDNVLSKMAGTPYLLATTYSPVGYSTNATVLAEAAPIGYGPMQGLSFVGTTSDGDDHTYAENLVVPPGMRLSVTAHGTNTNKVVQLNGSAVSSDVQAEVKNNTSAPLFTTLTVSSGTQTGAQVDWIRGMYSDITDPAPDTSTFVEPRGGGNLVVVPQTLTVSGISARVDDYTMSVDLKEVWPWL